ncbi:MAG: glycosyl transferase [Chryseolinea sp.]
MDNSKVLIIAYYWPPSGGSGVQRWLKFVKYLPEYGWKPYVFTPKNPSFDVRDESLMRDVPKEAEIIRFPIWEPYGAFNTISSAIEGRKAETPTAMVSGKKKTFFQTISTWVRGNFIIPDPRIFWVRPSVKFLDEYLTKNGITKIITTGPPHSVHLIGLGLKKRNQDLKWFADFRDPWSEWGFLDSIMVSSLARRLHKRLESKVLKSADEVITITPFYVRQFERLSGRKVRLLTNGFDDEDFALLKIVPTKRFVIRHIGTVNEKCNPRPFMIALEELSRKNPEFKVNTVVDFVGEVHPEFISFVMQSEILSGMTIFTPSVPHKQLVALYGSSSVMLLILTGYKDAEGYMPGKLFEYLATGLPIIATGPEQGDAANLLNDTASGVMIDSSRDKVIQSTLLNHFGRWQQQDTNKPSSVGEKFSRRGVTRQLAELLRQ